MVLLRVGHNWTYTHIHTTVVNTVEYTHLTASGTVDLLRYHSCLISLGNDLDLRAWLHPGIPSLRDSLGHKLADARMQSTFSLFLLSPFPTSIWVNSEGTHLLSHSWYALSYPLSSTLLLGSTKNAVTTTLSVTSLCPALGSSPLNKPSPNLCGASLLFTYPGWPRSFSGTTLQQNTVAV